MLKFTPLDYVPDPLGPDTKFLEHYAYSRYPLTSLPGVTFVRQALFAAAKRRPARLNYFVETHPTIDSVTEEITWATKAHEPLIKVEVIFAGSVSASRAAFKIIDALDISELKPELQYFHTKNQKRSYEREKGLMGSHASRVMTTIFDELEEDWHGKAKLADDEVTFDLKHRESDNVRMRLVLRVPRTLE